MHEIDRTRRVSELLRRELSMMISRELNDKRVRGVSINSVTTSRDLKYATIYVSQLEEISEQNLISGKQEDTAKDHLSNQNDPLVVEKVLNNAAGYLRMLLSKNSDLRVMPNLRFKYDDSIKRGVEMSSLIDSLNKT